MDDETIVKVNQIVYTDYPYLNGIEPEVHQINPDLFLVIYKGMVETANGHQMPVFLRLTADNCGKILKMTSSR